MPGVVYVNGQYCLAHEASISVFDRGFLFGDAVYEVIPVYGSRPFALEKHLLRLESSLAKARIPNPPCDWVALFQELIRQNGGGDLQLYLQITRGNQGVRKHDIPAGLAPSVIAFTLHTPYPVFAEQQKGLQAKLVEDIRWQRCDIKTTSLLGNILVNDDAVSHGYHTALLIRDGFVTEGSASNLFIVDREGQVKTPPLNHSCLPGITREICLDLLRKTDIVFSEEPLPVQTVLNAREVWITSTTKELYPVTRIDETVIGNGVGGPCWRQLHERYQQLTGKAYD
ncbi:D-amino acid aminotransferase [Legionella taurinensis]|uniref:Aminodeoxychorismate lyase n=1 Tax=Legionella taurinensis TaxID=70611 RepID=A0A3A5L649_9GAMM|nr:D-amino acid aminotransferase [Legionella taurinensis]RJT48375.1 D-amino acid aminotransferase [Legionella taurinensis]RJT68960.1 D-amino acid aminotransferase [Legionella taurinensis]STY26128.1 D-alanine transaminase [Legionella taurinensis]